MKAQFGDMEFEGTPAEMLVFIKKLKTWSDAIELEGELRG